MRTVANVVEAKDGQEALDIFNTQDFDLLITDIAMPKLTGDKLISEIRKIYKDFPCIITTAYRNEYQHLAEIVEIIKKPVNMKKLLSRIQLQC